MAMDERRGISLSLKKIPLSLSPLQPECKQMKTLIAKYLLILALETAASRLLLLLQDNNSVTTCYIFA